MTFGLISSLFDYLTFGVLIWLVKANATQFRTAWFVESVVSAATIVLVIRTRKAFYKSAPGKYLAIVTLIIVVITVLLPYTPVVGLLGFEPLPIWVLFLLGVIVMCYIVAAEIAKRFFYKIVKY